VQERTDSVGCAQRRHPSEEDEYGSCDDSERPRGWIRIIYYGRDGAARWSDHVQNCQGGGPIGRRGMMVTNYVWTPRTQRPVVFSKGKIGTKLLRQGYL
jgi:hypothetical protein